MQQTSGRAISHPLLDRWPTALAVALVLSTMALAEGAGLAFVVGISALVYLAAAVFEHRKAAWPVFLAGFVSVGVTRMLDVQALVPAEVAGAAFLVAGVLLHRGAEFRLQALGMLAFGTAAAVALLIGPVPGALLVAAGLIGHGSWDVWHHRRDAVVPRPYAEFCAVVDFLLGAVVLVML